MDEKALFLRFWDKEAPATRKVLSRIPQEKSDYKPDAKSRTAREIAWLLVHEEMFLAEGLERGHFEWIELPTPATMAEIVAVYDARHEELTERMKKLPASSVGEADALHVPGPGSDERDRATRTAGSRSSIRSTTAASSRRISGRWDRPCRRSTGRAPTSRCSAAGIARGLVAFRD